MKWTRSQTDVTSKWDRREPEVISKWDRNEIEVRSLRRSKLHLSEILVRSEWNRNYIEVRSKRHRNETAASWFLSFARLGSLGSPAHGPLACPVFHNIIACFSQEPALQLNSRARGYQRASNESRFCWEAAHTYDRKILATRLNHKAWSWAFASEEFEDDVQDVVVHVNVSCHSVSLKSEQLSQYWVHQNLIERCQSCWVIIGSGVSCQKICHEFGKNSAFCNFEVYLVCWKPKQRLYWFRDLPFAKDKACMAFTLDFVEQSWVGEVLWSRVHNATPSALAPSKRGPTIWHDLLYIASGNLHYGGETILTKVWSKTTQVVWRECINLYTYL